MAAKQPNVIFVLTDDQGYGDLSCTGNPILKTPAIDRLYDESVRLTDFHVAPVCTPTRGELMTGHHALHNGATFVCMGRSLLRSDLITMPEIFADNGYHTGHFGKWHLGDNYPYRPQDRGFHETIYHPAWGITSAPDYFGNDYFDDHYRHKGEIEQFKGYCTDVWFNEALKWIDGCNKRNEKFFAYIATNAPHGPLWVPDQYRQPYLGEVTRDEASFFGMISNIDENMAGLEKYLQDAGLRDDTVLIFMTDNGTASGQGVYNAGMRGKKSSLYDGGHRVPCFFRWPASRIGGGRDVDSLTRGTDILPTLVDLCGLRTPDGWTCDGYSLGPQIRDPAIPATDRMAVVQYGHANEGTWGYSTQNTASVLWNSWRLVNGNELYDIRSDPGQERDISGSHPDVVAAMGGYYVEWWDDSRDTLSTYQRIGVGSDSENPVRLCSADWAWVYADNPTGIRGCVMDSGTWHVDVHREGLYRFALRRWPKESGLAVTSPAPEMVGFDGNLPPGVSLPIASAWLEVGETEKTQPVESDATEVVFELPLSPGPAHIRSWWNNEAGEPLTGAFYLSVERV